MFSPRGAEGVWDVRDQPPEFWDQFNASPPPGAHLAHSPDPALDRGRHLGLHAARKHPDHPALSRQDGKRYRSLGDAGHHLSDASTAATIDEIIAELETTKIPERSGRAMDHESEDAFERLRVAGYL